MKINGGEMLARMLDREGVKNIFGLHGGHIDPIFQAAYDHDIRIIDTRHEQAAGHMADAWARTTGEPGVAVVTAGPGVTDIVTAVANAHIDAVPMVVIGGRFPVADEEGMPLQELHGLPLMESITKWSRLVRDPKRLPEYVNMAFRQATSGRPGPVFLEIPADVLATPVEEDDVRFPEVFHADSAPAPSAQAIEAAADMIAKAERPVILAGRGVWFSKATDELREFAELANVPVCANGMTRGAVPEGTRLGLGSFMVAGRGLPMAGNPDVVLLIGAREGMFTGGRNSIIPADAKLIKVDIEAEEMSRGRSADIGIVGDCKETLLGLSRELQGRELQSRDGWLDRLAQVREATKGMLAGTGATSDSIHPFQLAQEVSSFVEEEGVLVADGGETFVWAEMALEARRPGRYLGHGYLGCLGTGIPFGLAAKLAHPDERVLVLTGDGSVGLNFPEFDTAVRHNLPIAVVVNNDAAWGMCKHEQQVKFGGDERVIGTDLNPTRYEQAAEAFGVHAEFVENAEQISPAIERAFASGRPACINVMTDRSVISPAVQAGGLG